MIVIGSAKGKKYGVKSERLYNHRLGWRVLRAYNKHIAHELAKLMQDACYNDMLKYDQNRRTEVLKFGIYANYPVCCDCSSLVTKLVRMASLVEVPLFTTDTLVRKLMGTGMFYEVPYHSDVLCNGDILVTKQKGHTAIIISGAGINDGENVPSPTLKKGSRGVEVFKLQNVLNKTGAGLVTDGIFGKNTKSALMNWQYDHGLVADGIYGKLTYMKMKEEK